MNFRTLLCMLASALVLAAFPGSTRADTLNLTTDRDNTLYQDVAGAVSNGAGETLFAGKNNNGSIRRGLLHFDIAGSIPAGSTINSVSLTLHLSQSPNTTAYNAALHRATAAWGQGTSNASAGGGGNGTAATIGDATWLHTFFNSSQWSAAGGDFAPVTSAITSVAGVGNYTWTSPNLAADVQAWLDQPATNFGWMLVGDETTNQTVKRFDTRENSNATFRPSLTIDFTPVPEPSAAGLAAVGLLAAACLRKGAVRRSASYRIAGHKK